MEFRLFSAEDKEKYKAQLLRMLTEADNDFLPPLSQRNVDPETNRNTFSKVSSEKNIGNYCDGMLHEAVLGVFEEGELCGFVSFAENLRNEIITETPNIYIGTAVISEKLRGRGTLTRTYDYLFNTLFPERNLFTRTWSTNAAHIRVLEKFGFEKLKTIPNDRGDGIDTIYFAKKR